MGFFVSKRGFTLAELMVTVAILALLATVVLFNIAQARAKGRDAERTTELQQIQIALRLYKDANGSYPDCASGMQLRPGGTNPAGCNVNVNIALAQYLPAIPTDPLGTGAGNAYVYDSAGTCGGQSRYVLYSRQTEAGLANWNSICSSPSGFPSNPMNPNSNSYGIILQ